MSIPPSEPNQEQIYTHLDFGTSQIIFELIQSTPGRWEQIAIAVKKQTRQEDWTLEDVKQYLIKTKNNVNLNLAFFNRTSYASVPQETTIVTKTLSPREHSPPKLETKLDKCTYYSKHTDKYLFYLSNDSKREFPLLTVLYLVPVFRIVSKKLKNRERDKPECYKTADGDYEITGPILCTYDSHVLSALLYMYSKDKSHGLSISCNFTDIYLAMNPGVKCQLGVLHKKAIRESLTRLQKCHVNKKGACKNNYLPDFQGPILINGNNPQELFSHAKTTRLKSLNINLNPCFIEHFIHNCYTKANLDTLLGLSGYEHRLLCYLLSRGYSKNGIDYRTSTLFSSLYSNQAENNNDFNVRQTSQAVSSLIELGLLDPLSQLTRAKSRDTESHYYLRLSDGLVPTKTKK